jgi:hypothetical protein
VGEKAIRIFTK